MSQLLTVSLRHQAIFIPAEAITCDHTGLTPATVTLVANLANLGFGVSEQLLKVINNTIEGYQAMVLQTVREVMGVHKNWTPLVKEWDLPTGESMMDHIATYFANIFKTTRSQLPCGHSIPGNTFPLYRYNGCPFCGTPFVFGEIEHYKQGSDQKILELWTLVDADHCLSALLSSKTALDATQADSLKLLLQVLPLPDVCITMKETAMLVIDTLIACDKAGQAKRFLYSPTDILRYLWYKNTGFLQLIEPSTIIKRATNNSQHFRPALDVSAQTRVYTAAALKLKYTRKECAVVAQWLNNMNMPVPSMCEAMHPKRNMWVRFIRALRLAEYSKRTGYEKLRQLLDAFYNEKYEVWQGHVNHFKMRYDAEMTMDLLKQRPGLFARSLFANMLWFGAKDVIAAFTEIIDKVPGRLVFTLYNRADTYFSTNHRVIRPLGGVQKNIQPNYLVNLFSNEQLEAMKAEVAYLCYVAVEKRFATEQTQHKTMYIDPQLFKIPVSIGDRSDNIQDLPAALMGTRFPVEGTSLRLFMQWGTGLPAQHLDMDLSCNITFKNQQMQICSYAYLTATGCKHSGDIRSIPEKKGTAEYIELDLPVLQAAGATYVTFTCNAYSAGAITPNLVVGWMNSKHPMKISGRTGVAYDPSCVQHQVRIVNPLAKGLVFGVLDVQRLEIIWLEIPFNGEIVQDVDGRVIKSMLKKMESQISIGQLLQIKAGAQKLQLVQTPIADEVYDMQWARNAAAVTKLLID